MSEPWPAGLPGVLRLPSGRLIRGRGLRRPVPDGPDPAFGLYLLGKEPPAVPWESAWFRWPDFGLPADRDAAIGHSRRRGSAPPRSGSKWPARAAAVAPAPRWPAWRSWTASQPAGPLPSSGSTTTRKAVETLGNAGSSPASRRDTRCRTAATDEAPSAGSSVGYGSACASASRRLRRTPPGTPCSRYGGPPTISRSSSPGGSPTTSTRCTPATCPARGWRAGSR